jgi:hypothetical protein
MSRVSRRGTASVPARVPIYRELLTLVRSGAVIPVISVDQPLDWEPERSIRNARELADLLDAAPTVRLVQNHAVLILLEVVQEAVRLCGQLPLKLPRPWFCTGERDDICHFFTELFPHYLGNDPAILEVASRLDQRYPTVSDFVQRLCSQIRAKPHLASMPRSDVAISAFQLGREELESERRNPVESALLRVQRMPAFAPLLRVCGIQDVSRIWTDLATANCPVLALWCRAWPKLLGERPSLDANSTRDIAHLPCYAHADFSLTERRMADIVSKIGPDYSQRVFARPDDLLNAIPSLRHQEQ